MTYDNQVDNAYYWNIFPVQKTSIEAYATTYCYFDRMNHFDDFVNNTDREFAKHIHDYNLDIEDDNFTFPAGRRKWNLNEEYKKNINDPSMKYTEEW